MCTVSHPCAGFVHLALLLFPHQTSEGRSAEVGKDLRVAKDRAEESNRLKSAFLANMSHEIRTPLNSIVGFSDVLAVGGNTEEEQQTYYQIIKTNSDLLLRLINDILDLSRLEANRVTLTWEECDVVQLCRQVVASVSVSRQSGNQFLFVSDYESFPDDDRHTAYAAGDYQSDV